MGKRWCDEQSRKRIECVDSQDVTVIPALFDQTDEPSDGCITVRQVTTGISMETEQKFPLFFLERHHQELEQRGNLLLDELRILPRLCLKRDHLPAGPFIEMNRHREEQEGTMCRFEFDHVLHR